MDDLRIMDNRYYPLFIDLTGKPVVVVGGGMVAWRKIEALCRAGARVRVIAPDVVEKIAQDAGIEVVRRDYEPGDLDGAWLVIAATDDEETNIAVSRDAGSRRIFCNAVDQPGLCSFIVPSVVEKGPIKIAISTGGVSPALSKKMRIRIGKLLGDEYSILALIMGRIRPIVLSGEGGHEDRKRIFEVLIDSELLDAIRGHDRELAEQILFEALGQRIDLTEVLP
ncbi:MAG: bifunctional precorrin-2 dehydrogenase/sirohydrochlorin ferrochelatase [Deltaproteobacteria bacterium]|jgi:siroheme synthase-like protein|nr:bifunctional precorrin-2 dehydrogenase/sirohydrochlorin ferrochelatase [Deltaproteobacteria bacterium]MDX9760512.1 bifunctional precorrin-2 dehydrogenase/sirohydrochlorin ferrochelatase [Desulfomonilia bacterium]HPW68890.1 bifunctional precorrin-2 dehydrogenase/sirohydrochlorin ferrochelatase [Deltaproteobacteria bacterium]